MINKEIGNGLFNFLYLDNNIPILLIIQFITKSLDKNTHYQSILIIVVTVQTERNKNINFFELYLIYIESKNTY